VVGGRNSNNTLQLLKACQAAGKRSFHIERTAELQAGWFDGVDRVGVTAGTSTLKETVASVKEWLERL
jgi:4-hydroxy-3-methylbut-2-en-1-yl diphosphate reductase